MTPVEKELRPQTISIGDVYSYDLRDGRGEQRCIVVGLGFNNGFYVCTIFMKDGKEGLRPSIGTATLLDLNRKLDEHWDAQRIHAAWALTLGEEQAARYMSELKIEEGGSRVVAV